ncbi:FG-GAP-like repeat-containing protein [Spirosoma jeollabukense]
MSDVNADGIADIIVGGSDVVWVLLGQEGGKFLGPQHYPAGTAVYRVTVGDVNEDGRPDIITTNQYRFNVTVLLAQGGGRFGPPSFYFAEITPNYVAVSDVNGDGHLDIITDGRLDIAPTGPNASTSRVSILIGDGDGRFGTPTLYPAGSGHLVVRDINADGHSDIITANNGIDDASVAVLMGKGDGSFGSYVSYPAGNGTYGVAVSDINADGYFDIITANLGDRSVSVLLGQVGGGFGAPIHYSAGWGPFSVAISDVNRDGYSDIITANYSGRSVSVLLGKAGGSFLAATEYSVGGSPHSLTVSDINKDDHLDIITGNGSSASVLLGSIPVKITKEPTNESSVCIGTNVLATVSASGTNPTYQWYKNGASLGTAQQADTLRLTNVQRANADSYWVVVTGSCSSVTSTAFSLTVSALPTASLTNNGPLTCANTSVTLTASGGDAYLWDDASIDAVRTITTAGTYSVTVTSPNGCTATDSQVISFNNTLAATAGASLSSALIGSVVSLSATGGSAYLWSASDGASLSSPATSPDVLATLTTAGLQTFTVVVTEGSCSQTLTVDVKAMLPPDLIPLLYVTPSLAYSTTTGSLVVDVFEINSTSTNGTITVHIAKSLLMSLSFDPGATSFLGRPVQNNVWTFDATSNTDAYILTTTQAIEAGSKLSVGLSSLLTPGVNKGNLSVTATLVGGSGGEVTMTNNTDADQLEYFSK